MDHINTLCKHVSRGLQVMSPGDSRSCLKVDSRSCLKEDSRSCRKEDSRSKPRNVQKKLYYISYHHNSSLTSVQVILVPYCCLFCVLSNDMLNVSGTNICTPKAPQSLLTHAWITKHQNCCVTSQSLNCNMRESDSRSEV